MATGKVTAEDIELVGGRIGAFEITLDGELKFSKLKTHRFPAEAEIDLLIKLASLASDTNDPARKD